jgi:hypothetical protein
VLPRPGGDDHGKNGQFFSLSANWMKRAMAGKTHNSSRKKVAFAAAAVVVVVAATVTAVVIVIVVVVVVVVVVQQIGSMDLELD